LRLRLSADHSTFTEPAVINSKHVTSRCRADSCGVLRDLTEDHACRTTLPTWACSARPATNISTLRNTALRCASVAAVKERRQCSAIPAYPLHPLTTRKAHRALRQDIVQRRESYTPLRQFRTRRAPKAFKEYARKHPRQHGRVRYLPTPRSRRDTRRLRITARSPDTLARDRVVRMD